MAVLHIPLLGAEEAGRTPGGFNRSVCRFLKAQLGRPRTLLTGKQDVLLISKVRRVLPKAGRQKRCRIIFRLRQTQF